MDSKGDIFISGLLITHGFFNRMLCDFRAEYLSGFSDVYDRIKQSCHAACQCHIDYGMLL